MKASEFVAPPRRSFPAWVRVASLIPLYGIASPIVKTLELFGVWPKIMARRPMAPAAAFGDYRPSAHDVIVCSYFKAGTTWTLQIATQIAFRSTVTRATSPSRAIQKNARSRAIASSN